MNYKVKFNQSQTLNTSTAPIKPPLWVALRVAQWMWLASSLVARCCRERTTLGFYRHYILHPANLNPVRLGTFSEYYAVMRGLCVQYQPFRRSWTESPTVHWSNGCSGRTLRGTLTHHFCRKDDWHENLKAAATFQYIYTFYWCFLVNPTESEP